MMRITAVVALFNDLPEPELVTWVERGWVRPLRTETDWTFQEIDVARVRLIHDLRRGMALPEDAVPLILSLMDQVYDLRGQLRAVLRAVEGQPDDVRTVIRSALRAAAEPDGE